MLLAAFECDEIEPAPVEAILRCHTDDHVERVRAIGEPTWLDGDTFASETSFEAALLAAGAAIAAAERGGFALARPPGHHAPADRAMGFCLFNNVAVAAAHARAMGADKVAIVDYDVHHGNGTQHLFEADPHVLVVELEALGRYAAYPCELIPRLGQPLIHEPDAKRSGPRRARRPRSCPSYSRGRTPPPK